MRNKKKLSLLLAGAMLLSNFSFASTLPTNGTFGFKKIESTFAIPSDDSLSVVANEHGIKNTDVVRVMVEMDAAPVIDYAIKSGNSLETLSESVKTSVTDELIDVQAVVKQDIVKAGLDVDYLYQFTDVFNGFSATMTMEDAMAIEDMPNVKRVIVATEYFLPEPEMVNSQELTNSNLAWDLNFKGEGMLVAVLDTTVDPYHNDMQKITAITAAAIQTAANLPSGLPGKWYNDKVPYGYNYYDNSNHLLNPGNEHGMHVAGTVGANGKIKGVAPEAQILAMKVFGDDPNMPSTFSDIYVRAIEDALKLGADAINMSLGSTASFLEDEESDPARVAIRKATEMGCIVAISAGNSNKMGSGHLLPNGKANNPLATNPDVGVVGSPSLNPQSLSVASVENKKMPMIALDSTVGKFAYMGSGELDPVVTFEGKNVTYMTAALGQSPADFAGFSTTDGAIKIALIQRGGNPFTEKILNAQNAGAKGVIIYNSAAGGDTFISMATDPLITIPAVFVGLTDGTKLANAPIKTVSFKGEEVIVSNINAGKMSAFTSWGTTPNLDFKPEITAPGGQIYSTLQDNKYGLMSGTSMAAPHVAGGAALVLQRVDKDFPNLTPKQRFDMAKNLLMSTSKPLKDIEPVNAGNEMNNFTSPRRQGAGVMDLLAATTSTAIVVNPTTNISKVNLREINSLVTFPVEIQNFGSNPITYVISGTVQSDLVLGGRIYNEPQAIYTLTSLESDNPVMPISFEIGGRLGSEVTVPANGKVTVNVTVDTRDAADLASGKPFLEVFKNGGFIEGFVRFVDKAEQAPAIGIPYMGFRGDWAKAPVIDIWNYDASATNPQYYGNSNAMTWLNGENHSFLGYEVTEIKDNKAVKKPNKDYIAFSPNGDKVADAIKPINTFLRNARTLEVNILDTNKKVVRKLDTIEQIRKNYYDGGRAAALFRAYPTLEWDGKIDNKVVSGQFYYQMRILVDGTDKWQEYTLPVIVDTVAPVVNDMTQDDKNGKFVVAATDNHKISTYYLTIKDATGEKTYLSVDGKFDLTLLPKTPAIITVAVADYALNVTEYGVIINDKVGPVVDMPSPEPLSTLNTTEVLFAGTVKDNLDVASLTVAGQPIELKYNDVTKVYDFAQVIKVAEGSLSIPVEAKDINGNVTHFERRFAVDAQAPVINLTKYPKTSIVTNSTTSVILAGTITDNYSGINLTINGNKVYSKNIDLLFDKVPKQLSYTLNDTVIKLAEGNNKITIEVKDQAGNTALKEFNVYRKAIDEKTPSVIITSQPQEFISSERPAQISAESDQIVDWTVKIYNSNNEAVETVKYTDNQFLLFWAPEKSVKLNGKYKAVVSASKAGAVLNINDAASNEASLTTEKTYEFSVYNYPIYVTDVKVVKKGTTTLVEAEMLNLGPNVQQATLIAQVSDSTGKVVNISTVRLANFVPKATISLGSGFDIEQSGNYTVKVFVWTGWDSPEALSEVISKVFEVK